MPSLLGEDDPRHNLLAIPGAQVLRIEKPDSNQPDQGGPLRIEQPDPDQPEQWRGLADTYTKVSDYIRKQQQKSEDEGYWTGGSILEGGHPTNKGLLDVGQQWVGSVEGGLKGRGLAPRVPKASTGFSVDPAVLPPKAAPIAGRLGSNADDQLAALGLPTYADIVPSTSTGKLTEAQLKAGTPKGEVFDLGETWRVPDVEQTGLTRIDPSAGRRRGLPEHIQQTVDNPDIAAKLRYVAEQGAKVGGASWYNAEPLRLAFVDELGSKEGNEQFKRYMSIVGATSAGSDVGQNVRAASYYQHKERLGEPVRSSDDLIPPYGHKMQQAHVSGYKGLDEPGAGGTLNPETQPKRSSFVENLGGNQDPVTVDKHNLRLIGMLSQDPRFLNTRTTADVNYPALGVKKGDSVNWRDEVTSGRISMEDALKHPHMWQDVPDPAHYGALEGMQQKIAREMGMTPAQFQAALWVGGGRVTGLRSLPTSFMGTVENRLQQTAQKRGITPQEALQQWLTNKAPLLSVAGAGAAPLLGSDQEPRQ